MDTTSDNICDEKDQEIDEKAEAIDRAKESASLDHEDSPEHQDLEFPALLISREDDRRMSRNDGTYR